VPPPFAQILKCPNCNAPLEAPASSGAVFCTYCGSQVIVQQRTLAPAPPHPRAPQPLPAVGSAAQLRWIVSSLVGAGVIIAVTALFVVGSLRTAASSRLSAQNTGTVEIVPARLREVVMSQTLAQLASWAGVKANSEARLELSLKGSRFQSLVFYWPTPGAVDITQVMLSARMPIVKGDPVLTALSAVFGARFTGDTEGGTTFESNALRFSVRSREVEVRVWPEKHPNWQRKMAVLWQVARALVLQEPIEIDAVTRRDVLGTGYPLRMLGQVNPAIDVDQSQAHVTGLFPGVSRRTEASGLSYVLPLDHPWFKEAELLWKNEKGGKLVNVRLDPPPFATHFANQTEIRDCLARRFGAARDAEINHLANEHSYQFQKYWPHASVYVGSTYLWLELRDSSRVYPVNFKAVVEALAACAP